MCRLAKLHIVHVLNTLEMGGAQKAVIGLATSSSLSACRHSILCMSAAEGALRQEFVDAGISIHSFPNRWPDPRHRYPYRAWKLLSDGLLWAFPLRLAARLRQLKPNVVHTHTVGRIAGQADAVVLRRRIPWVWTLRCLHTIGDSNLRYWRRAVEIVQGRPACITAASAMVAEDFKLRMACPGSCIQVVPTGGDLKRFEAPQTRSPSWRKAHGIPDNAILFGAAGRLEAVKAHHLFLKAAATLVRTGAEAHFVIAGDGPLRQSLEREIAVLELGKCFHLIGEQYDMATFYPELDVFVLPSLREGFGIVLVEALASGLACVATRVGAAPEILAHGGGILAEVDSVASLTNAMRRMLSKGIRQGYAAQARAAATPLSMVNAADRFADIYSRLLSGSD